MSANSRFRGPYARGPHDGISLTHYGSASLGTILEESSSEGISLKQTVEALIKRVDAQDEKIRHLEKYKEKSVKLQEFTKNQHKMFFEKLNKLIRE